MASTALAYGIDLGTTNGVVAVRDGEKISVIPNREGAVTTPSAVHIDRRGRIHVGAAAKARAFDEPENTAVVFKRTMGQGAEAAKRFTGSGRSMLPEELSAEILKQLRGNVRDPRWCCA